KPTEKKQHTNNFKNGHRNPKRSQNNFSKENKADRHTKSSEDSEKRLSCSLFTRSACAEADENRDKSNWIDCDKDRNKSEEKLFNHGTRWRVFALPKKPSTQCSLSPSIKPFQMKNLCLSILLSTMVVDLSRSEERRVGKEGRSRRSEHHE